MTILKMIFNESLVVIMKKTSKTNLSHLAFLAIKFEILSIDIADIDVGENIGAKLQTEQAGADLKVAQAKAEGRRAMAVALEQEMTAKAQEARANVIEAEVQIPLAMSDAFKSGNLGVMDYYRMRNIEADTDMRDSIADESSDTSEDR